MQKIIIVKWLLIKQTVLETHKYIFVKYVVDYLFTFRVSRKHIGMNVFLKIHITFWKSDINTWIFKCRCLNLHFIIAYMEISFQEQWINVFCLFVKIYLKKILSYLCIANGTGIINIKSYKIHKWGKNGEINCFIS